MATTNLDVANGALIKLGEKIIASLAGTDKASLACNARLEPCKRAVLRSHPWNFAVKRIVLNLKSVTNAFNNAGAVALTVTGHGFSTGNKVTVSGVVGTSEANGQWTITVLTADTFELQTSTYVNAYISGGLVGLSPAFDYLFQFALPSDFIRVIMINEGEDAYRIEGKTLITNLDTANLKYIYDVTDYDVMDPLFHEALEYYLAWDICFQLTQSTTLKEQMWESYDRVLKRARFVNATEEPADTIGANDFLDSRVSGARQYVRDPMT